MRIHSRRNGRLWRQRDAMANRTILLIKIGPGNEVGLGCWDGDILGHLFLDSSIQRLMREKSFKRHVGISRSDGCAARRKIEKNEKWDKDESKN